MRNMFWSLLLIGLAGAALAQAPTATLVGRILDRSQAAIPGVSVSVRSVDTNQVRAVQTEDGGEYTVSNLSPGFYEVTITKSGFKSLRETKLELQAGQTARLDSHLEIGQVTETLEVKAETMLLNTETSSRGEVISPKEIAEIPLNGRDFNDLAFTVAGVQPAEQGGKGSPYVVNGTRADASNVLIDGLNNQNPRDAGSQARPPLDSLQEFKLQTSGYSAEYGRMAGGVVNMVLKTGANQLHGALFEFLRNDKFDARNFFDAGKSKLRRNQFGGSLSGPLTIPKLYGGEDRTFFVVSWESYRQVQGSNNLNIVPTLLERRGDFSQSFDATGKLILVKDPLLSGTCTATNAAACFKGNLIPPSRFNPISAKLLDYYPLPNAVGPNNYLANGVTPDNWDSFLFKVDKRIGAKDTFTVRVLERWQVSTNPFSGTAMGGFGATTDNGQGFYGISETRILTPSLINEFRGGLTRTVNQENSTHAGTNYAAQLGITGTTNDLQLAAFPKFTVTGFATIGDSATNPIRYTVTSFDWNDVLTWNKGRHTLKVGAALLRSRYFQPTNSNFNGTFAFNGRATNNGFADFLLGYNSTTSRKVGTVTNHIYSSSLGAFVQDDYKVLPSLTLNLGLRYEIQDAPYEKYGLMTNYVPSVGKALIGGAVPDLDATVANAGLTGLIGLASDYGLPRSLVNTNYNSFAPRVGFAWRPFHNNRTVVRSGYGIFYTGSRLSAIRTDLTGGFPFSLTQTFTGSTTNPNLVTLSNPFPAALAKVTGVTGTNGYEVNAPSPYLQSWNFTVERELAQGMAVEVGYTGSKGTHLGRKMDINQIVRRTGLRPYAGYGDIEYYTFGFNSSYNAGTVTLRKRFGDGMFFRANYTYGKSIDVNSGLNYAGDGGYQGAQDTLNPTAERGRSDFDVRHVFSTTFAYRLPFQRNLLVRGWQIAGTGQIYSGQPFTPQLSGPNSDQGFAARPDRIANGALSNPAKDRWFDLSAFQVVPDSEFRFGNSGRNILNGPGTVTMNLSVSRNFFLSERHRIQFRAESFNFTNHTAFQLPNDALDRANAGTIIKAKAARVMQLGLKYQF